jgi:threonine aldolase
MNAEIQTRRQFASDNYAGICPEAFAALTEANRGHASSYGNDPWTQHAADMIRDVFETQCEVFFVFNGTAANSLALASLCQSYHSILCYEHAHIETAECGCPEFFAHGTKVLLLPGADGKIDPAAIAGMVTKRTDIHYPKPRALSLTQATDGLFSGGIANRDRQGAGIWLAGANGRRAVRQRGGRDGSEAQGT